MLLWSNGRNAGSCRAASAKRLYRLAFFVLLLTYFTAFLYILPLLTDFVGLFFTNSAKYAISEADLTMARGSHSGAAINPNVPIIPKIIHQTYKTDEIPEKWREAQESCKALHPDYQYILWTDVSARQFIAENYPWFLSIFDRYPYNIMRSDVLRYFVLNHYGGVYIDLDIVCTSRLDPLLAFAAWARQTEPVGISNDVMGSVPNHLFFQNVIGSLTLWNYNWSWNSKWVLPYFTIMYCTGPLFLTVVWNRFKRWKWYSQRYYDLLLSQATTQRQREEIEKNWNNQAVDYLDLRVLYPPTDRPEEHVEESVEEPVDNTVEEPVEELLEEEIETISEESPVQDTEWTEAQSNTTVSGVYNEEFTEYANTPVVESLSGYRVFTGENNPWGLTQVEMNTRFFADIPGSSWHMYDARVLVTAFEHPPLMVALVLSIVLVVWYILLFNYRLILHVKSCGRSSLMTRDDWRLKPLRNAGRRCFMKVRRLCRR